MQSILYGTWSVNLFWIGRTDSVVKCYVALALKNTDARHPLFTFFGEGSAAFGWGGVILGGGNILDFRGTQDYDGIGFVDLADKTISVKIFSD